VGVLEDVPIKVRDLYVPVDFAILEMEEDLPTPSFMRGLSCSPLGAVLM